MYLTASDSSRSVRRPQALPFQQRHIFRRRQLGCYLLPPCPFLERRFRSCSDTRFHSTPPLGFPYLTTELSLDKLSRSSVFGNSLNTRPSARPRDAEQSRDLKNEGGRGGHTSLRRSFTRESSSLGNPHGDVSSAALPASPTSTTYVHTTHGSATRRSLRAPLSRRLPPSASITATTITTSHARRKPHVRRTTHSTPVSQQRTKSFYIHRLSNSHTSTKGTKSGKTSLSSPPPSPLPATEPRGEVMCSQTRVQPTPTWDEPTITPAVSSKLRSSPLPWARGSTKEGTTTSSTHSKTAATLLCDPR